MSIQRWEGYHIVVADQNGKVFYTASQNKDMYDQLVSKKVHFLTSFEGLVEHIALDNTYTELKTDYAIDFRQNTTFLYNVRFVNDSVSLDDRTVLNNGKEGVLEFDDDSELQFKDIFFQIPKKGLVGGTFEAENLFDGIACNDRHMTTKLANQTSYIRFNTPTLTQWQKENTFEFWFKIDNLDYYADNNHILSINDKTNEYTYLQIYIEGEDLVCAPFGIINSRDPALRFTDFKLSNVDVQGWWHISCSYEFQERARCVLYNSEVEQVVEASLSGLPKYYPMDSLRVSLGATESGFTGVPELLVKEFRIWNRFQSQAEIANSRYSQIDPSLLGEHELLLYIRFGTGTSDITNFVDLSPTFSGFSEMEV